MLVYKSHVADCETCWLRDSRKNNRGREKSIFLTNTGIPFEILQADMVSQKIPINWIELAHDDRSKNTLTDVFPDPSPNEITKNTFEIIHAL